MNDQQANDFIQTAILTDATCGDACWYARQDICRCSCNGKRHGVLLVDGAPRPSRNKRKGRDRFVLVAVVEDHLVRL